MIVANQLSSMAHHGHDDVAPVSMDPRFSEKVYPRKDNIFWHKKSLDFDLIRTKVFVERKRDGCEIIMEWVAFSIIGLLTGLTAAIMSNLEEKITVFRRNHADDIIGGESNITFLSYGKCVVNKGFCFAVAE